MGLGQRPLGLLAHLGGERIAAGQPAAGVHDGERHAGPFCGQHLAVTGDAGLFFDHGRPLADDAVHQRRLAHIGPPGDHHHRQPGERQRAGVLGERFGFDAHAAQADRNEVPSSAARSDERSRRSIGSASASFGPPHASVW